MNPRSFKYKSWLLAGVVLLSGCAFFARKPPLPKQASVERLPRPTTEMDYFAAVQNADVIYFPTERAASAGRSEPAALVLEALEKTQKPFGIGWEMIQASQQPLLDQLESTTGTAREELIAQLELVANGRAREHCRAVLREAHAPGVQYLALRSPAGSEAGRLLFAAQGIIHYLRHSTSDNKLLVFASAEILDDEHGLPYFVAQKADVRQLIFGPRRDTRPKLLTRRGYIDSGPRS